MSHSPQAKQHRYGTATAAKKQRRAASAIGGTVGIAAVLLTAAWLRAAKLSKLEPLAYLRYPIRQVETVQASDAPSARLSQLNFNQDSKALFISVVESPDRGTNASARFSIEQPDIRALAFSDPKIQANLIAVDQWQSSIVALGKTGDGRQTIAHAWSYTPSSSAEGTVYNASLMRTYELEPVALPTVTTYQNDSVGTAATTRIEPKTTAKVATGGSSFAVAGTTQTGTNKIWIADKRSQGAELEKLSDFLHEITVPSPVTAITFSTDGHTFATAHENDTAYLWNTQTGNQIRPLGYEVLSPPRSKGRGTIVFGEGDRLVAMVDSSAVYLWETETGELLNTFTLTNEEGTNIWGRTRSLAISSDGQWIASDAGHTNKVYFWDTGSGELLRVLRSPNTDTLAFSPDNTHFASANEFGDVTLWKLPEQLR